MGTLGGPRSWLESLGFCHPRGRPGCISWLPAPSCSWAAYWRRKISACLHPCLKQLHGKVHRNLTWAPKCLESRPGLHPVQVYWGPVLLYSSGHLQGRGAAPQRDPSHREDQGQTGFLDATQQQSPREQGSLTGGTGTGGLCLVLKPSSSPARGTGHRPECALLSDVGRPSSRALLCQGRWLVARSYFWERSN